MKKKILAIILSMACVLSMAACGNEKVEEEEPVSKITVTFNDGDAVLGQITGDFGETIDASQYEAKEGFEFLGWFETPSFLETSKKDPATAAFTADTTLYGSWKSLNVTVDDRVFYVVGDGKSPVLKNSGWAGAVDDSAKEACKLQPTENVNESTLTLDMFAGDMFQVIYNWQWDGQYGFGKVTEFDASCFESGGGLSGETNKANISVIQDGNYTITLRTDVDNPKLDSFAIVRNGDPVGGEAANNDEAYKVNENTKVVVKGSWVSDWSENIPLEATGDGYKFTLTKEFEEGTELYFMIWDNDTDTGLGMKYSSVDEASKALLTEADNVKLAETATYTFTVDAENMTINITK